MEKIQKVFRLPTDLYYMKHLEIVSTLLPTHLTETEIKVLAAFLSLDNGLTEDDMFNTTARKRVMAKLGMSPGGLGNHLKSMIGKKVLDKNELSKRIRIKDFLLPDDRGQGYQIKIIKDE